MSVGLFPRRELEQDIYVTVRTRLIAKYRAEQRQARDTEGTNLGFSNQETTDYVVSRPE